MSGKTIRNWYAKEKGQRKNEPLIRTKSKIWRWLDGSGVQESLDRTFRRKGAI